MRNVLNIFIYTYIWVGLGAASLTFISSELQGISGTAPAALTFLLTLCSYSFIRLMKNRASTSSSHNEEELWNRKHPSTAWITFILSSAVLALLLWEFRASSKLYETLVLPAVLTFGYSFPTGKTSRFRLREVPGIKILTIALSWGWTAFFIPTLITGGSVEENSYAILISLILYTIAITIPFDIRDLHKDDFKMRTLPQVLGAKGAGWLGIGLLVISGFGLFTYNQNASFVLCTATAFSYAGITIGLAGKNRSDFFYSFWVEASPIVWAFYYWAYIVLG